MGTRGILGVHVDGVDKISYNHSDSYPEGLGHDTLDYLNNLLVKYPDMLGEMARKLKPVTDATTPTPEDIERCSAYTDLKVSNQSTQDWYCLLRGTQGNLLAFLEAGIYKDAADFAHDSLMCEFGYITNLDSKELEIYRGFQKGDHDKGRFSCVVPNDDEQRKQKKAFGGYFYSSIALIGVIPFSEIVSDLERAKKTMTEIVVKYDTEKDLSDAA